MRKTLFVVFLSALLPPSWGMGTTGLSNEAAIGAKELGMFNCVTAQADGPTAVFFNPAGLAFQKGGRVSVSDNVLDIDMQHESFSGEKTNAETDIIHVPSLFSSYGLKNGKLGFGLGIYSPFGLETRWGNESFAKYSATLSRFHLAVITPSLAYAFNDHVSLGGGIDVVRVFDTDLRKRMNNSAVNGAASPDGESRFRADGTGFGANAGVLYKINPVHSVGLSARSPVRVKLKGSQELTGLNGAAAAVFGGSAYATSASAQVDLPASVVLGYANRPSEKLVVEVDGQWTGWSSIKDFGVSFSETDPLRRAILDAGVDPATRNWEDTWSIGIGTAYDVNAHWTARLGAGYLERAVPERTFDPSLPDANRTEATAGFSYKLKKTQFHFAYNAAFFETRRVSNSVAGGTINGTYRTFVNSWAFGVEQRF